MNGFELEYGPRASVCAVTVPTVREHVNMYFRSHFDQGGVLAMHLNPSLNNEKAKGL